MDAIGSLCTCASINIGFSQGLLHSSHALSTTITILLSYFHTRTTFSIASQPIIKLTLRHGSSSPLQDYCTGRANDLFEGEVASEASSQVLFVIYLLSRINKIARVSGVVLFVIVMAKCTHAKFSLGY